jgi:WXXGXW repeat (2 copies)
MKRILGMTFAACAIFGLAQAASAQEYYGPESLPPQPPAVREDFAPAPPPAAAASWMPGHYEWNGRAYFWVDGRYINQPVGLIWEPGRWVARAGQWVWIGGHWRR